MSINILTDADWKAKEAELGNRIQYQVVKFSDKLAVQGIYQDAGTRPYRGYPDIYIKLSDAEQLLQSLKP